MSRWRVVTFRAWQGQRYIGLAEILVQFGGFGLEIEWSCFVEEAAPEPSGTQLEDLDPGTRLDTLTLLALVAPNVQVIDGRFDGYRRGTTEMVARIRAVDSTDWDIEAMETNVLHQLAAYYPGARGPLYREDLGI
jgi:hypothetical protein